MKLIAQKILTLSRKRLGFIYTNFLKLLNILLKVQPDNYDLMRGLLLHCTYKVFLLFLIMLYMMLIRSPQQ